MRNFTFIWIGQLISLIGTWMASFALDIWVFQTTGSATQFALVTLTTSLPMVLVSPLAGTLIDRWNRRWTVIISDSGIGICILILSILVSMGELQVWQIYLINTFISLFGGFQNPAYKALITCLVPIEKLPKASGMVQLALGIQQIASPLLAGLLLSVINIQGILIIDLITVIIALIPLLIIKEREIAKCPIETIQKVSLWEEMSYGWKYLKESYGLTEFLILYSIYQFLVGCVFVLAYPLVLSLSTSSQLGIIMFIGGLGILTTSLIISKWGHEWDNLSNIVIIAMILSGLWIAIAGLRPSIVQISVCTLLFFLCSPIINGLTQVILQKKVPPQLQGRIFALTGAISTAGLSVAAIFAAPLADNILEPRMEFNGPWANNIIGQIIGSGPGRGIALLFVMLGLLTVSITFIGSQYPGIRKL